jgi:hypothetical protein
MPLRDALAAVPAPIVVRSAAVARGIDDTVAYLGSDAARRSLAVDPYWPKWHGPWWHMLVLHELGEAARIPSPIVAAMVDALARLPLHVFPIHPGDAPPNTDGARDVMCHCGLGCVWQVLAACGVDVAGALPWTATWFARYQLADGGLSCDEQAYLATDECPSSMVGTIAPLEAMLLPGAPLALAEARDRAARFLIGRALTRGSATVHNAAERAAAAAWPRLCFPRLYFYDALRGLAALVRWAEATGAALPWAAVADVTLGLIARFPDGVVHVERRVDEGRTTVLPTADRAPSPRGPATRFPLLDATAVIGAPSEALTRQWAEARRGLIGLLDAGRLVS